MTAPDDLVHVSCARCGADDARVRFPLVRSRMVTCRRCGLSYVDPRASPARIAARLQEWAGRDVVDAERLATAFDPGNLGHYARLLAALERHAAPGRGRLLDVGCSTGAFMQVARAAGWEPEGLEIGAASSAYARDQLGFPVRRESIYDHAPSGRGHAAVALLEVIEHLERPAEALARIHALLAPGGLLLLTTPNFDSLYRRLFGPRWWVINCEDEHIVLFTMETLRAMLLEHGFEPVECRIRGLDLPGMLREARRSLSGGALRRREAARPGAAEQGYYEDRASRMRLRALLARSGLLGVIKAVMRGLDRTFGWRLSPTYAWGEQLIVVARRVDGTAARAGGATDSAKP